MADSVDAVAALLADPATALVAVDFDGTLAAIVDRPQDARPVEGAAGVLADLAARIGGVAIISGRAATEVVALAALSAQSQVRVLGHYGLQTWRAGSLESPPPAAGVDAARTRLAEVLGDADPGVRVEDKTHSLAVHTRGAASPAAELEAISPRLIDLADECDLEAVPGRYVIELRPPGTDKGAALLGLVAELGSRTVIYVGDDLGDLPAYDAVDSLRHDRGVAGLTVASVDSHSADAPDAVAERADLVLTGPVAVVAWLTGIAAMLG